MINFYEGPQDEGLQKPIETPTMPATRTEAKSLEADETLHLEKEVTLLETRKHIVGRSLVNLILEATTKITELTELGEMTPEKENEIKRLEDVIAKARKLQARAK